MTTRHFLHLALSRWLPLLVLAFGAAAAGAQQDIDPPSRVASLSLIDGSVAFAPAGETEWADAVLNRPITRGDRLWTDRGARAELHLGSAVLHIGGLTFLDLTDLDDDVLQASLNEGTVNARVRELARGENFEIDTPQLAFRASRPGDYRIDVDPSRGTTRVTVRSGAALVYGAGGKGQELVGGQVVTFARTDLERVAVQASLSRDGFDLWAADRNRAEDESMAARYVPRDVVGYQQLDPYGSWSQDASYGAVWYPRVTVTDWAPYRYGHWEFIAPWGWTWIDDAPWGFAPFHYGRWAMIGSRWAWVPGRLGPRPVYAPALVVFVGGSGGVSFSLSIGSGSGIGWFPLAPGEAWRPYYRTSPRYVTSVNRYIVINNQVTNNYIYINQRRPSAVTAVGLDDFSRGRPVHRNWRQLEAGELDRVRIATQPTMPEPRRIVESRPSRTRALPPPTLSAVPVQPRSQAPGPTARRRDGEDQRPIAVPRPQVQEQQQAQRERERAARELERSRRDQQVQQERTRREQRDQQMQVQRQQDEQRRQQQVQREQERAQREQDRARRDQQVQQEGVQRDQALRDNAMRHQQQAQERAERQQQQAQERVQRQQQAAQEQVQRQQQQRGSRQQAQPQVVPAPEVPPAPRERGRGKPEREQRDDNRSPGGDEGGRGRGQGRGG
ncbi:MAG: chromosome partitioning protein ParA [Ramlibacter sp.]|nr:chromosome partitioning protein ParA [Ramlibacter sp.]